MKPRRLHSETIFSINSLDFGSAIGGVSFLQPTLHVKGTGNTTPPLRTPFPQNFQLPHIGSKLRLVLCLCISVVNLSSHKTLNLLRCGKSTTYDDKGGKTPEKV